jgi:hypothetical protein
MGDVNTSVLTSARSGWLSSRFLVGASFAVLFMTVFGGRAYDGWWHARYVFDSFFSPPHVFVYVMTAINVVLVGMLYLTPDVHRNSTTLALSGLGLVMVGGLVLDNIWHSNFGLNETLWSAPHAMLQWGWLVTALGLMSATMQLISAQGKSLFTLVVFGLLLVMFSVEPMMGPLHRNNTPDFVSAFSMLPSFVMQPTARLTQQIYIDWNLTRANPIASAMGAVWVGVMIAFITRLDQRPALLLIVSGLWALWLAGWDYMATVQLDAFLALSHNPANWLPMPFFPTAVAFVVLRRFGERMALTGAAVVFGLLAVWIWQVTILTVPFVIVALWLGSAIGGWLYAALREPSRKQLALIVSLGGLMMPALFGSIDLLLRSRYL